MTQIQHISAKEMARRTGVRNALGYTYPDKNLILLRKGLKGKLKRTVLDHEMEHLSKGEEGPFDLSSITGALAGSGGNPWGMLIPAALSFMGTGEQAGGVNQAISAVRGSSQAAQDILSPYAQFGTEQLGNLRNWLSGPSGAFSPVSMQDVTQSPGFEAGLTAVENSAIARGGLQSGNALRQVSQFGSDQYQQLLNQRRQQLMDRLNLLRLGMGAAQGQAGYAAGLGPQLANLETARGNILAQPYGDIAGLAGQWQQQRQWQDFLDQYKKAGING